MLSLIISSLIFLILCFISFSYYIKIAIKKNFVDKPENYSSHQNIVPTGAGIVIVILILLFYIFLKTLMIYGIYSISLPNREYLIFISILFLGLINFYDDIVKVHPLYRLATHFFFVLLSLPVFSYISYDLFYIIPEKVFLIFLIFSWAFIINIFNFLDGSDGYLTLNALPFFISFCLIFFDSNYLDLDFLLSFFTILILLIYLIFNFPKAKIFMGDSGSITIGYLIGYIFFVLIFKGYWYISLALIAYPLMDVSLTIIRKMKNGHYPWERLFDYFFLRALKAQNFNHNKIFFISSIYNLINITIIFFMIFLKIEILVLISIFLSSIKIYLFNSIAKTGT